VVRGDDPKLALKRWRGLASLVVDAVDHGSRAVERVHLKTAELPFTILEKIPGVAVPAKVVHVSHDALAALTYASIRLVNRGLGATAQLALGAIGKDAETGEDDPTGEAAEAPEG